MIYQNSGDSADFAQLKGDITNLSKEAATFMKDAPLQINGLQGGFLHVAFCPCEYRTAVVK